MNTEQTTAQIKELDNVIAQCQGRRIDLYKELKALAEAEKPRLRHGDYGINANDLKFVILNDIIHWSLGGHTSPLPNDTVKPNHISGNVFKEMEVLSEPLKKFQIDSAFSSGRYHSFIDVKILPDPREINISTRGGQTFMLKDVKKLFDYLRQLLFTAEKEEAK